MSAGSTAEGVFASRIDEVVAYVEQGLSVSLVGTYGSGRTELLRLVADRLDDLGVTVLRLHGNRAWRQEPFGALVAAGIGVTTGNAPAPRRSIVEMTAALGQHLRGRNTVLVVDDADDLDTATVGALLAAHRQRPFVAVTSSLPPRPTTDTAPGLALEPWVRLRMRPLDLREAHQLASEILDGPVEARTLSRIHTKSAGLPGVLRTMVTVGRHQGLLRLQDGVWDAPGELWDDALAATTLPYLTGISTAMWEAASTLAMTGPIPLDAAAKLIVPQVLQELLASGLVQHTTALGGVIGLFPPLVADHLRREGSVLGHARAIELTGTTGIGGVLGRTPAWGAGSDAALRNQRLVQRAADDVVRLEQIWRLEPNPSTAMPLLVAMRAAAAPAGQIEHVVATTPPSDDFADARMQSWYATWTAVDQVRLDDALTILERVAARLPAYDAFFGVTRAHLVFLRDHIPDLGVLADLPSSPDAELLDVLRAEIALAQGRVEQARGVLDGFHPRGRVATAQASLMRALAAVLGGDLEDGIEQAHRAYRDAFSTSDPGLQQSHAYVAVLGLGLQGRLADASHLLIDLLSAATAAAYRDAYRTGALGLGATIAIGQGRPEYAAALTAQASADPGRGPFPGMEARVLRERLDPSIDLWPAVRDRSERGYAVSALFLAVEAVERDRDVAAAAAVVAAGEGMDGPLLPALAAYVGAAAEDDTDALAGAAEALEKVGAQLYAVRARVTRALALRRRGDAAAAVAEADLAWQRSAQAGYDRSGLFARLVEDVALSEREVEIVGLLARPMTTPEVAAALQTSVRTVETHIHNISRKIGTSGREAMLRATATWLRAERP
jgi:DNA-binding CsgD family transcriptional regulator